MATAELDCVRRALESEKDCFTVWNDCCSIDAFEYDRALRLIFGRPDARIEESILRNQETEAFGGKMLLVGAHRMGRLFAICERTSAFPGGDLIGYALSQDASFAKTVVASSTPRVKATLTHYARGVCAFLTGAITTTAPRQMRQAHLAPIQGLVMYLDTPGADPFNQLKRCPPGDAQLKIRRVHLTKSELEIVHSYVCKQFFELESEVAAMAPPVALAPSLPVEMKRAGDDRSLPDPAAKRSRAPVGEQAFDPGAMRLTLNEEARINAYHEELRRMVEEFDSDESIVHTFVSSLGGVGAYDASHERANEATLNAHPRVVFDRYERGQTLEFDEAMEKLDEPFRMSAASMRALVNRAVKNELPYVGSGKENKVFELQSKDRDVVPLIRTFPFEPSALRNADDAAKPGAKDADGVLRVTAPVEVVVNREKNERRRRIASLSMHEACAVAVNYLLASQGEVGPYVRNVFVFRADWYDNVEINPTKPYCVAIFMQKMQPLQIQTVPAMWDLIRSAARLGIVYTDFNDGNALQTSNGKIRLVDMDSEYVSVLTVQEMQGGTNLVSAVGLLYAFNALMYMLSVYRVAAQAAKLRAFMQAKPPGEELLRFSTRVEQIAHSYASQQPGATAFPMKLFDLQWSGGRFGKQLKRQELNGFLSDSPNDRFANIERSVRKIVFFRTVDQPYNYFKNVVKANAPIKFDLDAKNLVRGVFYFGEKRTTPQRLGALLTKYLFLPSSTKPVDEDKLFGTLVDEIDAAIHA